MSVGIDDWKGPHVRLLHCDRRSINLFHCPQFIEKSAFGHLVEIAPVGQILRLDVLRARIGLDDFVENRLDAFRFDIQAALHDLDLAGEGGVDNFWIADAELFADCFIGEFPGRNRVR
jgi:hypothetical protein